jgi:hypothetical protein
MASSTLDSNERRTILRHVASGERNVACDVVARIALDEVNELDRKLLETTNDYLRLHQQSIRKVTG